MTATAAFASSRSEFVRIRGLRYHIRRWGRSDAPALWLCHGWLDVSATWAPVAHALLPHFQILAPDWRGYGHTQWPQDGYWFHDYVADLDALADHYSSDTPLQLVGHSMGAQIASLYAGLRPQRVRRLICLDGLFLPDMDAALAPKRFLKWLEHLREPTADKFYESFEALALRVRKQHPQLSDDNALFIARCWGREDGRGRVQLCADPKHRLNMPGLFRVAESMTVWQQVTAPTLLVHAGRSPFLHAISNEQLQARHACFRDHRVETLADAGHMMHFDAPEATARVISHFLQSVP